MLITKKSATKPFSSLRVALLVGVGLCATASTQAQVYWEDPAAWQWEQEIPSTAVIPIPQVPALRASGDLLLQRELERGLTELGLSTAVAERRLSVALVELTERHRPRLAAVNGDEMFYAASLPKIGILLGAFQRIADGQLWFDTETHEQLTLMIRNSSNRAATAMLRRVGKSYLAGLLQSKQYRLYDRRHNGGLWIGKEYARTRYWQRDLLHNLSHSATAIQTARFYYLLENGRLVSPRYSRQMKEIMGNPAVHHKFVKGLEQERPGSVIFRKSGTWRTYHSDSAIVERDGKRYIAVALCNDRKGGEWMSRLIVKLDDIIFTPPRDRSLALAGPAAASRDF
ncbi:MAG: serine hydrolase [Gammaproteobacteria bacterium]